MALITYEDKEDLNTTGILEKYKITAENTNEIKRVVNENAILTTLEEIGLSTYTTLDDLVNAIPDNTSFSHYLSGTNATTLYNKVGGTGNLPIASAGLLVVKRQNNYWYVDYLVNAGIIYHATKLTAWIDWRITTIANIKTNGDEVLTGRIIDGKEEYIKRGSQVLGTATPDSNNKVWRIASGLKNVTLTRPIIANVQAGTNNIDANIARFDGTTLANASQYCYFEGATGNVVFGTAGTDRKGNTLIYEIYYTKN